MPDVTGAGAAAVKRKPLAYICDIDGTIAISTGRGYFDWSRVGEDAPNLPVIRVIRAVKLVYPVVFVTGRMEQCRAATREWISKYVCDHDSVCFCKSPLRMREDDDFRSSRLVKKELYLGKQSPGRGSVTGVCEEYDVQGAFDDRRADLDTWKDLGVITFDVSGGGLW